MYKTTAIMHGNHIYTCRPLYGRDFLPFKYVAFIDGRRWRLFKTRKEFEQTVGLQPEDWHPGQHARDTEVAELISSTKGSELLDSLLTACRKQREAVAEARRRGHAL